MKVYDFDKTIFYPDSSFCFMLYCLKEYPAAMKTDLGRIIKETYHYIRSKKKDVSRLKEELFSVLRYIPDPDKAVEDFWEKNYYRIRPWYFAEKREDDVIISASPEFLLRPATERLGVRLIATPMNIHSGIIQGSNCHGEEKVRRFREVFGEAEIDEFYSDSLSDTPMAKISKKAFLIDNRKNVRKTWPEC